MDMSERDKLNLEKAIADHQSSSLSSDWQRNLVSASSAIPMSSSSSCPPAAMVEYFNTNLRGHQPLSSLLSGFTSMIPGKFHPSLSLLPADAAFIERAARFSSFNGGNFSGIMNSLSPPPLVTSYAISSEDTFRNQLQNTEFTSTQAKDVFCPGSCGSINGSPVMNQEDHQSSQIGVSSSNIHTGSKEANTKSANASPGTLEGKKRKRIDQDTEIVYHLHQGPQSSLATNADNAKSNPKVEENRSQPGGKNVKGKSEAPKGDYVHIRARRGQATNSHSLAERVRREKISERMKYLQDLVPSCSKVTGKAVMLDEIINYVQSLQRQVEFLSMKLAAVNPGLDYNVEALFAKDIQILQPYAACSSFTELSREMAYPLMHPSQQGFLPARDFHDPAESVLKVMSSQMANAIGYKHPMLQAHNQDLPNLMQMTYEANPRLDVQEVSDKTRGDLSR